MAKPQPKAKGRNAPVVEKPKRERPSRTKATTSVAQEHKQAMRDTSTVGKAPRVTAPVGTAPNDPLLRLDPDMVGADPASLTPTASPITASIAQNLGVYLLELEYKHYEDDSNPVAQLVKRNAQDASTHLATVSLVVTDLTKYVNDGRSASGSGILEVQDGIKLTEELKYYVNQAITCFTQSVDSRIHVTRCVVQLYALPGIPFII